MRLYRAIPIDGKDFVYGWYSHVREHKYYITGDKQSIAPERHFIIQDDSEYMLDRIEPQYVYDVSEAIEVIPETVAQQVGCKDKNDTEAYDGDTVKTKYETIHSIIWRGGGFYYSPAKTDEDGHLFCVCEFTLSEDEIIGNKWQPKKDGKE